MNCTTCGSDQLVVIDSRADKSGKNIRRRRKCLHCDYRFTTYETSLTPTQVRRMLAVMEERTPRQHAWSKLTPRERADRIARLQAGWKAARRVA